MGTAIPMGIVSLKAEGAYAADKLYKKGMWVTSSGSSYAYINPTPAAGVPLTDTSHWQQIASMGGQDLVGAAVAARDAAQGYAAQLAAGTASPAGTYADLAALIAANPDHSKIYITLDDGNWCYHNGTAFVAGGVYQATERPLDTTLSVSGMAADAKVTGDKVGELKSAFEKSVYTYKKVIDVTDSYTLESASEYRAPHPFNFVSGERYIFKITVMSATWQSTTNILRANTSSATGDSTSYLQQTLISKNSPINNGDVFETEFTASSNDKNILLRYKFGVGSQSIKIECWQVVTSIDRDNDLNTEIENAETEITDIKDAILRTTVCIDATDTGTYESTPSTVGVAHPFNFIAGKTYHATLTVNAGAFLEETNAIRVQQSSSTGTSTTSIIPGSFIFSIDNPSATPIVDGETYETDFVAYEGCVNLLARYKFTTGSQNIDLDVTITEPVLDLLDDLKANVDEKYADCIQSSRMQMGAHRGAESFAPPNCVAAYEIAGKMGFPWAWLAQIRWSSSGTLYVMHDADVSITTNGTGNIQDLTDEYIDSLLCNKIQSYDYSQFSNEDLRVPTLEKAIQICLRYGMKMCFRIEPFPNQIETELHQTIWDNFETLVKEYGISNDWCCFSGYNAAEIIRCANLFGEDADICPFLGSSISSAQDVVDWFENITSVNIKNKSILLGASGLTLADVKLLHANGIKVYAFTGSTLPTQEQMEQLAAWGVDILQNPRYARIPIV